MNEEDGEALTRLVVLANDDTDNNADDGKDDEAEEEAVPAFAPCGAGVLDSNFCLLQSETPSAKCIPQGPCALTLPLYRPPHVLLHARFHL